MSRITAEGGKARFVAADLTDPAQLDHLVDQAGPVDVLVNNAQRCGRPVLISGAAPDRIEALGATTPADPARPAVRDRRVIAFLASRRPATSPARSLPPTAAAPPSDPSGRRERRRVRPPFRPAREPPARSKVPEPKTVKNRGDLDLISDTFDAETERLLSLAARRLRDL